MHVYTKWSQNTTCKEENKYKDTKSRHKYAYIDIVTKSHAFNRSQYNKCFMPFLPYIQYNANLVESWFNVSHFFSFKHSRLSKVKSKINL